MKGKLEDLDLSPDPIDDRWTLTKLMAAGWSLEWERTCRTCGDAIEAYRHEHTHRLLILNEAVLTPHRCDEP